MWSQFSPGTKVQALHWYIVFRKGARWEPDDTLPLRCRGFFFGRLNQMAQPQAPDFDRDEVIVCTLIAFCIGNFTLETIYRLFG